MSPKLLTKRNRPTAYGLACGYVDRPIATDDLWVSLWREHNCYHVRRSDFRTGARLWLSYELSELKEARAKLAEIVRLDRKQGGLQ